MRFPCPPSRFPRELRKGSAMYIRVAYLVRNFTPAKVYGCARFAFWKATPALPCAATGVTRRQIQGERTHIPCVSVECSSRNLQHPLMMFSGKELGTTSAPRKLGFWNKLQVTIAIRAVICKARKTTSQNLPRHIVASYGKQYCSTRCS